MHADLIEVVGQRPSSAIREDLATSGVPVLLAFSGGKDSLAAWLALRDAAVPVIVYSMYYVPRLGFVEREMERFEAAFGQRIHRYPHPSFFRWLNNLVFQAPERCEIIEAARFPDFTYETVATMIRADLGVPGDTWIADGVRAADSIVRRTSIATHGAAKEKTRKVSVVWDWRKSHVMDRIAASGIALPVDYEWFGRSFDGIDYRFLEPLSRHAPDDYQRILDWFPLADLEIYRHGT